jgi:hypothetical protein
MNKVARDEAFQTAVAGSWAKSVQRVPALARTVATLRDISLD